MVSKHQFYKLEFSILRVILGIVPWSQIGADQIYKYDQAPEVIYKLSRLTLIAFLWSRCHWLHFIEGSLVFPILGTTLLAINLYFTSGKFCHTIFCSLRKHLFKTYHMLDRKDTKMATSWLIPLCNHEEQVSQIIENKILLSVTTGLHSFLLLSTIVTCFYRCRDYCYFSKRRPSRPRDEPRRFKRKQVRNILWSVRTKFKYEMIVAWQPTFLGSPLKRRKKSPESRNHSKYYCGRAQVNMCGPYGFCCNDSSLQLCLDRSQRRFENNRM